MPRHPRGASAPSTSTQSPPPMPGGAAGIPEVQPQGAGLIPMSARNPWQQQQAVAGRAEVKPREFMVTDGPRVDGKIRFNSDGYMVALPPGKVVNEFTHNLKQMEAQGIKLEPMPYEEPVPEGEEDAGDSAPQGDDED